MEYKMQYQPGQEFPWFIQRWYEPADYHRFDPKASGWSTISQHCCAKSAWMSLRGWLDFPIPPAPAPTQAVA